MGDLQFNSSFNRTSDLLEGSNSETSPQQEAALLMASVQTLPCFRDLIAVLFECFSIISLGYLSCRFKLISPDSKDLGSYLTTFALPTIIFLNIAQMEFQTINFPFLICMLVAKLLLFILVSLLTLTISYPANFAYAGSLSILATQSNDFALGYPLIKSLYGETKPEMLSYLSLMAPIQLLILNPLGIVMLEYHKSKSQRLKPAELRNGSRSECDSSSRMCKFCEICQLKQQVGRRHSFNDEKVRMPQQIPPNINKFDFDQQSNSSTMRSRRNPRDNLVLVLPARDLSFSPTFSQTQLPSNQHDVVQVMSQTTGRDDGSYRLASSTQKNNRITIDGEKITNSRGLSLDVNDTIICNSGRNDSHLVLSACTCKINTESTMSHREGPVTVDNQNESIINWSFIKAIASNPLIVASIVALLVNLTHGPEMPKFVTKTANTIAASFAAPALFVVGLSMYGKFGLILRNPNDLLLASILVLTKELVLPNTIRTLTTVVLPNYVGPEELPYLVDFSYLYGLLPTAPTACIIANRYGVLSNVVSISMLLSTFASAPLMLSASAMISQPSATDTFESVIAQTLKISSLLSMTLTILTLYALWRCKKHINYVNFIQATDRLKRNPAHIFLPLLAITQTVIGIGGLFWYFVEPEPIADDPPGVTAHHSSIFNLVLDDVHNRSAVAAKDLHDLGEPLITPVYADFQSCTACTLHYILSSSGLLMARFVILCIVVTVFARTFKGHATAVRVSRYMITAYALLGASIIISLVFDSNNLQCTAAEASLPSQTRNLVIRLVFNFVFIALAIPMFAIVFKRNNRNRLLRKLAATTAATSGSEGGETGVRPVAENATAPHHLDTTDRNSNVSEIDINESLRAHKRQFVTSCVSLTSETSSALTANTNVDTGSSSDQNTSNNNHNQQFPRSLNGTEAIAMHNHYQQQQHQRPAVDQFPTMIDCENNGKIRRTPDSVRLSTTSFDIEAQILNSRGSQYEGLDVTGTHRREQVGESAIDGGQPLSQTEDPRDPQFNRESSAAAEVDAINGLGSTQPQLTANRGHLSEFHKYSMLIVFMLIDSTLNLTSIVQALIQDRPYGTFVQIEVMNVAFDFGQGLITFLICGAREIFVRKW